MIARALVVSLLAVIGASAACAQETNVSTLLKDGFAIAGVIPSSAGPGIFLHNAERLFFCVVAETPSSADVTTRYCKPVR